MESAVREPTGQRHVVQLLKRHAPAAHVQRVLEVGGSQGNNLLAHLRKEAPEIAARVEYRNLDIAPPKEGGLPTVTDDICGRTEVDSESVDLLFCARTLEHVTKPWKAAEEITRIVRPGGYVYMSVPFSWRYHPLPIDFWRFSPACLEFLFDGFEPLECNFSSAFRRRDMRGFWKSRADAAPVDDLGGFRENWESFFFGAKKAREPLSGHGGLP